MAMLLYCRFALKLGVQHFSSPDGTAIQGVFHHHQKKTPAR